MNKRTEHNPWGDIFDDCPPETVYGLYMNCAIDAVGSKHGRVINDLSEEVAQLVFEVTQTAAYAVFEAAGITNDWRDMLDTRSNAQPAAPGPCRHHESISAPPSWRHAVTGNPVAFYREVAWTAQARERPELLCDICLGLTEDQKDKVVNIIDYLLEFALVAAGVDAQWDQLYAATVERMKNRKVEVEG